VTGGYQPRVQPPVEGMVLLTYTTLVSPPKDKYLIVASISPDGSNVGLVIAGSRPNPFAARSPVVAELQLLLPKDQRNLFALYSSYADCSTMKVVPFSEVQNWINSDARIIRGHLSGRERYKVKELLSTAPTIDQAMKTLVGL
jgi:hypothetical protein